MKESPRGDVPSRGTLSLPTEPSVPSDGTTLGVEKGHGLDAGWQSRRYHRVGRGIGASCAKLFAREGCQVVVNDYGLDTNGRLRGRTRRTRWWRRSRRQAATLWREFGSSQLRRGDGCFRGDHSCDRARSRPLRGDGKRDSRAQTGGCEGPYRKRRFRLARRAASRPVGRPRESMTRRRR